MKADRVERGQGTATVTLDHAQNAFAAGSFTRIFENNTRTEPQLMNFAYYSFATLTTTGFGDITPAAGVSRAISVVEAVAGQFFLAILIARLVSLEIIHSTSRSGLQ